MSQPSKKRRRISKEAEPNSPPNQSNRKGQTSIDQAYPCTKALLTMDKEKTKKNEKNEKDEDTELIDMSSDDNDNDVNDDNSFESQESIDAKPVSMKSMFNLQLRGYTPLYNRDHLPLIEKQSDLSKLKITLTKDEKLVFDEFMEAIRSDFFPQKSKNENVIVMRCAGGWVRDKLLGIESDDIDIAIDQFTGEEWGNCFQKFYQSKYKNDQALKMGTIKENPDKSKHLAAITFEYHNLDFDIVNLRKEIYSKNSRVPRIEFGTPKEDAFRRDLTFNSLFYNINDGTIEDWTGKGINDLKNGIARTPLSALETYRDDPLRVFRNIRHAVTKFGFMLDDDIVQAAQQKKIHELLETKVTRERFSTEIVKIVEGYYVVWALKFIVDFDLASILFHVPSEDGFNSHQCCIVSHNEKEVIENKKERFAMGLRYSNKLNDLILDHFTANHFSKSENEKEEKKEEITIFVKDIHEYIPKEKERDLMLSSFLYPWHDVQYRMKKNIDPIVMYFVLYSMPGLSRNLGKTVVMYHQSVNYLLQLLSKEFNDSSMKNRDNDNSDNSNKNKNINIFEKRLLCGLFLNESKEDWEHALWLSKAIAHFQLRIDVNYIENDLKSWIVNESKLFQYFGKSKIKMKNNDNGGKKKKKNQKKNENKNEEKNDNDNENDGDNEKILVGCWSFPVLRDGRQLLNNQTYVKHGLVRDKRLGYLTKCLKHLQFGDPTIAQNDNKIDEFVVDWLEEYKMTDTSDWNNDQTNAWILDWLVKHDK